jgi:hypothetical protein
MKAKIRLFIFGLVSVFSLKTHAQGIEKFNISCVRTEFVSISLSNGVEPLHRLFSSVPCKFIKILQDSSDLNAVELEKDPLRWDAFRFRSPEKPGAHGFTKFEYLGEAFAYGPRQIGIVLDKQMKSEFEKGKIYLENTAASLRHGIAFLKKDMPFSKVEEIAKDPKLIHPYLDNHLVLYAFPENTGKPIISGVSESRDAEKP